MHLLLLSSLGMAKKGGTSLWVLNLGMKTESLNLLHQPLQCLVHWAHLRGPVYTGYVIGCLQSVFLWERVFLSCSSSLSSGIKSPTGTVMLMPPTALSCISQWIKAWTLGSLCRFESWGYQSSCVGSWARDWTPLCLTLLLVKQDQGWF